jgi:hypothetical protein
MPPTAAGLITLVAGSRPTLVNHTGAAFAPPAHGCDHILSVGQPQTRLAGVIFSRPMSARWRQL